MATRKIDGRTSIVPPWVQEAIDESGVKLSKQEAISIFTKVWENMAIEFARTGRLNIRNFGALKLKTYVDKDARNRYRTRWVLYQHTKEVIRTYDNHLLNKESVEVRSFCVLCNTPLEDTTQINTICSACLGET